MNKDCENLWDLWMIEIFLIEKLNKGEYSRIIILKSMGSLKMCWQSSENNKYKCTSLAEWIYFDYTWLRVSVYETIELYVSKKKTNRSQLWSSGIASNVE